MWTFIKSLLFKIDAELAHHFVCFILRCLSKVAPFSLRWLSGFHENEVPQHLKRNIGVLEFLHPVGLAAGFDKNATILEALPLLGFAFAEIGTITPKPQSGNPKPRLFRIPKDQALFNRMGFNNDGMEVIGKRIEEAKIKLPSWFKVGVNIGKNKDTPNENAKHDYYLCAKRLAAVADFMVINVSSPNTAGLRALQSADSLHDIVQSTKKGIQDSGRRTPLALFVKIAPELNSADYQEILNKIEGEISGIILTNTLAGEYLNQNGGFSGKPLQILAREKLVELQKIYQGPIISVGGIMDEEESTLRLKLGATLVELYSGWIFAGPRLVQRMLK